MAQCIWKVHAYCVYITTITKNAYYYRKDKALRQEVYVIEVGKSQSADDRQTMFTFPY